MRCLFAGLMALAPVALQSQATPIDSLIGIWASEATYGPALRGALTVARTPSGYRATIESAVTDFQLKGDSVRFNFSGNGEFRGAFLSGRRTIRGFWVQPFGEGSLGQSFATPVNLTHVRDGVWQGDVVPLDDRYSLFLSIFRGSTGSIVAMFNNPELNNRLVWGGFRVSRNGDAVALNPADTSVKVHLAAKLDPDATHMVMFWPPLGRTLVLYRRAANEAVRLFPRVPRGVKYSYSEPLAGNDGLPSARASSVGFDEAKLASLVQRIADTIPTLPRAPFIHSLLVARKGKLVLEEYFYGNDRETAHDTRSAGKTFASVMLGAAMQQGAAVRPETPILGLLGFANVANPDPRKSRITIANLMTHSSGLACDDNENDSPGSENTMQSQSAQPNWWRYMLDLPMTHDPGSYYGYCSGGSNLVGAAVALATHTWLPDFFDRFIAKPLQFGRYYYNLMPTGEGYTGGGVHMRPRDLLKIGQLFLDSGVWNGNRIVSKDWVRQSTSKQIEWPYRNENVSAGQDGFMWHLNTLTDGTHSFAEYEANGNGGQLLIVVPSKQLVVVFTAGNYANGGVWSHFRGDIVPKDIIGALH